MNSDNSSSLIRKCSCGKPFTFSSELSYELSYKNELWHCSDCKGIKIDKPKKSNDGNGGGRPPKKWTLISPNGKIYKITNLRKFCDDIGLNFGGMWQVATKYRQNGRTPAKAHKGWKGYAE